MTSRLTCMASTPVYEGAKEYRMSASDSACGGAESEVPSSRAGGNVPKDLRFSIGPDIKDALPGFSWRVWSEVAWWVIPCDTESETRLWVSEWRVVFLK